jgi:hypothetical protein
MIVLFTMSIADNPEIAKHIVEQALQGISQRDIAAEYGVNQTTIAKSLKKPVVRALLEKAYLDIASLAPSVATVYSDAIAGKSEDLDERKFRLGAAKEIAGMIGLSPVRDSHNNVFFTNIIAPTAVTLSPMVARMLDKLADSSVDDDSIDVEYVDGST